MKFNHIKLILDKLTDKFNLKDTNYQLELEEDFYEKPKSEKIPPQKEIKKIKKIEENKIDITKPKLISDNLYLEFDPKYN